jgi:Signal transduction histidine kinase regulating C4-dicarboxylate transport system
MMPEMDGYQVCQQLKASEITKDIPVIFLLVRSMTCWIKLKLLQLGELILSPNPFRLKKFLARIETHLKICSLQHSLQEKNQDLATAILQLQTTQEHLIQSEKMAALGQLIAGIAHEINTPLGIIGSSIENIANFWDANLEFLPEFFQEISSESKAYFSLLMNRSNHQVNLLTSKEKRQFKQHLISYLKAEKIAECEDIADTLVDMGIYDNIEDLLPLFKLSDWEKVLNTAYQFASFKKVLA